MDRSEIERDVKQFVKDASRDGYDRVTMECAAINNTNRVYRIGYREGRAAFVLANNLYTLIAALLAVPIFVLAAWWLHGLGAEAIATTLDTITRYGARIVGSLFLLSGFGWLSVVLSGYLLRVTGHWNRIVRYGMAGRAAREMKAAQGE